MLLRGIHSKLIAQYDFKEVCAPSQSQVNAGAGDIAPRMVCFAAVGGYPLSIPQLNCLHEASFVRNQTSAFNAAVTVIPSQHRVSLQMLSHWQPFQDLKLMFACRAELLTLRSRQRIVATVEDSVLRTEMAGLESHEEDAPRVSSFLRR
jgi:hypothetical protein